MAKAYKVGVFGLQFGDEGKGNIENFLITSSFYMPPGKDYEAVVRFHGGANAGESYEHMRIRKEMTISHQVPVGIDYNEIYTAFVSGGMIHPKKLVREIEELEKKDIDVDTTRFGISGKCHVVLLHHLAEESGAEKGTAVTRGTTSNGISTGYAHAAYKIGMRFAEFIGPNFEEILEKRVLPGVKEKFGDRFLFPIEKYAQEYAQARDRLREFLRNDAELMGELSGKNCLLAGCQSIGLDVFSGANEYSSSSVTTRLPFNADKRVGVMKLVQSEVGARRSSGDTKWITYDEKVTQALRGSSDDEGVEVGKSTGRPRSLGYLDGVLVKSFVKAGQIDSIAATKVDRLGELLKVTGSVVPVAAGYKYKGTTLRELPDDAYVLEACEPVYAELEIGSDVHDVKRLREMREFKELDQKTQGFFNTLGDMLGAPIEIISTGPWTKDKIVRA